MNKKMLKPSILSISLLTIMASTAVSPALNEIKTAFPGILDTDVKMVLTLPALIMIPFSLLSGWFASRFSKKKILYVGLGIYLVFGIGGGFAQTFTQLLIIRGFLGIAIGLLMPLSSSLIFDFFDGTARNKMMGLSGSTNQLGGVLFLAVAGILASYSWRYTFGVYLLAFVTLLFVIFWLPTEAKPQAVKSKNKEKVKLGTGIFGIAFLAMMAMIVFFVASTDLALFVEDERPVFSNSTKLFSSQEELQTALSTGKVTDYTIQCFKNEGITLSPQTTFKEIEKGKQWKFTDIEKEYTIKKVDNKLVVYSGIGTSRIAGYALSLMGIPAILAGFLLSFLLGRLKNYLMPLAAGIMALGYYLLSISDSTAFIFLSVLFIGFAGGTLSPPLMLMIPKVVTPNARTLGIAIVSSSILFGQFISPLFMRGATTLFGNDTFRFRFQFLAVFIASAAVIGLTGMIISRKINKKANA
jgi:MFS family permease